MKISQFPGLTALQRSELLAVAGEDFEVPPEDRTLADLHHTAELWSVGFYGQSPDAKDPRWIDDPVA